MRRFVKWLALVVVVFVGLVVAVAITFMQQVQNVSMAMYEPLQEHAPRSIVSTKTNETAPFSVALIGVDERGEDKGRADTIVICTVNPSEQSAKLVSIPRDTYVQFADRTTFDKVNHSYADGGTSLVVKTLEQLLQIPIDYSVKVNMEGFSDVIEAIGTIEVDNAFAFTYEGYEFPKGTLTLDGEQALKYVRMRFDDPQGDFGRQHRQKQVLKAVVAQATKLPSVRHYPKVLEVMAQNVELSAPLETFLALRNDVTTSFQNLAQYSFTEGTGKKVNGIYYYFLNDNELLNLQTTLQTHLNLSTTPPLFPPPMVANLNS